MTGPLAGLRVLEMAGMGPGPFAAMHLADMGADVVRIDRADRDPRVGPTDRGRRRIAVDLKEPSDVQLLLKLVTRADVLIEGFRPGTMERLGLGPDVCLGRNEKLIYARMTGWGQSGPLARTAGHDINYISIAGALGAVGRDGALPTVPLNLVGDYGGGSMYLLYGIMCALYERSHSGKGQIVDAAMVDGAASLMTTFHWNRSVGQHSDRRGTNKLDSGAFFYDVYETADGGYMAVGCIEPQFYRAFRDVLGLTGPEWDNAQSDVELWPERKKDIVALFRTRTREYWCKAFDGVDACVTPVLSLDEVPEHEHNRHRKLVREFAGGLVPAVAPRLSRTPGRIADRAPDEADDVLADWESANSDLCQ
ncbi:CaiB/BaiF CoA transferase family protein [Rhodococcus artemisiae]|uniref:CaiB/BaiF CoA-transferase family protein n=1 Tax=Rhodococcus artemisiae TaxID=714159 RepID=A0ABU7LCE8_9NOCA|nr:CaiB/BaiF CoA-transferase family protein [Rhodococcus artemisiae]MEE2059194.1 CaiB/BaiF CoA-transferase family protein [Rhodococcus artemisiae]